MTKSVHIAWLRIGDLRLRDNPALWHASDAGSSVLPAFVWTPAEDRKYACTGQQPSGHRDWSYEGTTLQASLALTLAKLDAALHTNYKNRLQIISEFTTERSAAQVLVDVAKEVGASEVHYNRREEPAERHREKELKALCQKAGIRVTGHSAFLFRDPERCPIFEEVGKGQHVFKAFWAGWHKGGKIRTAYKSPQRCPSVVGRRNDLPFGGISDPSWPFGGDVPTSRVTGRTLLADMNSLAEIWDFSEEGAEQALAEFLEQNGGLSKYRGSITRDAGPKAKESRLSPFFRLGILSMVDMWWRIDQSSDQAKKWFRRCAWRDYAYWMLHHWQDLPEVPMRTAFDKLEWAVGHQDQAMKAWQQGKTGFPLVDAAMRELKHTGYLQQNMRHAVGQFVVEVLGADWRDGEEWFHLTLADSDLAINAMMWQHQGLSGVSQWLIGIDGHPVRHAKAADPKGDYVRNWVPELAKLPKQYLHSPWDAPAEVLAKAGVTLGSTYPARIVDEVDEARATFLKRAIQCRNNAHPSCFSSDGCDLLTLPKSSGLSMGGIRALTEKAFRNGPKGGGKGKRRVFLDEEDGDTVQERGKGKGKGKGKTKHRNEQHHEDEAAATTSGGSKWRKVHLVSNENVNGNNWRGVTQESGSNPRRRWGSDRRSQ